MYPLDNGSFGYTWKEEWILPYESLWGIIEKFKYLNMLDSIKTKGLEVKPSQCWDILEEREYYIYKYQTIFDSANLSKFFHIHPSSHFEAATKFIWNNQKEYIDDHIRICPKCIANGYHSYIHQFAWEDKCFIHPRENLIRTKTKYCLQIFKQPPFSEDEDIKKYLEPSIDVLNNLLLNKYPILSKNRWGEHVEYIGFIYHKSFFSEKASLKLKQCLKSILYNKKLNGGREVASITKDIGNKSWNSYNYYDNIAKYGALSISWFSEYCFNYAQKRKVACDEKLFSGTLTDFRSSLLSEYFANTYYDYDRNIIDIIIASAVLTGYDSWTDITKVFTNDWKCGKTFCILEEEFTNYIKVCAYDYQKVAFLELYKIIVDDLYNEVKEKAQQGIFANKTYRDIKLSFFLPAYIVFDNAVEMKIIRIDK